MALVIAILFRNEQLKASKVRKKNVETEMKRVLTDLKLP